jgi:hypothetical protein
MADRGMVRPDQLCHMQSALCMLELDGEQALDGELTQDVNRAMAGRMPLTSL